MSQSRKAALFVFFGTGYFFFLHLLGTISPRLFFARATVMAAAVLSLVFSPAPFLFYICFRREHAAEGLPKLKRAAGWAVGGAAALVLVYVHNALDVFQIAFLFEIRHSREMEIFWALAPWAAAALAFVFFLAFFYVGEGEKWKALRKAKFAAVFGTLFYVLLRTIIGVLFLSTRTSRWFPDLTGSFRVVGWTLLLLGFVGLEYFYLSFYRGKDLS